MSDYLSENNPDFTFFEPVDRNETRQNDRVAELLRSSLQFGPEHLNLLHDEIDFTDEAEVIAIQEGLEGNNGVELDWLISDRDHLVGYESKVKSSLSRSQLKSEIDELERLNPDNTNTLVVLTDDYTVPSTVETLRATNDSETQIIWSSWYDYASEIESASSDQLQREQYVIHDMLRQTFDEEGYLMKFEGLHHEPTGKEQVMDHQNQVVNLVHDVELVLRNSPLKRWTQKGKDVFHYGDNRQGELEKDHRHLVPKWFMFPFQQREADDFPGVGKLTATSPGIIGQLWSPEVYAVIRMAPYRRNKHKDSLINNAEEFQDIADEHDVTMFSGWRKWEVVQEYPPGEISAALGDESAIGEEEHKRIYFGYKVDGSKGNPRDIVEDIAEKLVFLNRITWEDERNQKLFYPTIGADNE